MVADLLSGFRGCIYLNQSGNAVFPGTLSRGIKVAERNPKWTRDELILALDLYVRHRPSVPGKTSAEVIELSETFEPDGAGERALFAHPSNPNGIAINLLNFRSLDPDYTSTWKVGLHHTGRGDGEIWCEFASDPPGYARRRRPSPLRLPQKLRLCESSMMRVKTWSKA